MRFLVAVSSGGLFGTDAIKVAEAGRRHRQPDLIAIGLMCQGRMMMYSGRVPEALALLDEAMALVAAGEVSPIIAGT